MVICIYLLIKYQHLHIESYTHAADVDGIKYVYACVCIYVYIYIHICTYLHTYICWYKYILTNTYIYIIHTYMYIDTHRLKTWRAWMCTQTKQTNDQVTQGVPLDQIGGAWVGSVFCSALLCVAVCCQAMQGVAIDQIRGATWSTLQYCITQDSITQALYHTRFCHALQHTATHKHTATCADKTSWQNTRVTIR